MKTKSKKIILFSLLSLIFCGLLCFAIAPQKLTVYAQSEDVFIEKVYEYTDEGGGYTVTLISETEYTLHAVRDSDELNFKGTYTLEGSVLQLFMLGEPLEAFEIQEDNTLVMVDTTDETTDELPEETKEGNYFREKVMPYITANLSGILSGLLAMLLTLGKIKAATTELKASTSENSCLKKKNKQLEEKIVKLEAKVEAIDKNTQDTKEMVKIGFCNTSELVINGYAEKIAKVGENEEETES